MKRIYILVALIFAIILLLFLNVKSHRTSAPMSSSVTNSDQLKTHGTAKKPTKNKGTASFDKTKYSIDNPTSPWVVVNKKRALYPLTYIPANLTPIGGGQYLNKSAAVAFVKLQTDAKKLNLGIVPISGYRSYQTQVRVYGNEVKLYGQAIADTESAKPGHSEHQTGWAIDVGGGGCGIENCFGNTKEGKWLAANAYKYGYIVRYTAGKQSVTGYRAEPWHIRYIGTELSNQMQMSQISTLEEFFGL